MFHFFQMRRSLEIDAGDSEGDGSFIRSRDMLISNYGIFSSTKETGYEVDHMPMFYETLPVMMIPCYRQCGYTRVL